MWIGLPKLRVHRVQGSLVQGAKEGTATGLSPCTHPDHTHTTPTNTGSKPLIKGHCNLKKYHFFVFDIYMIHIKPYITVNLTDQRFFLQNMK